MPRAIIKGVCKFCGAGYYKYVPRQNFCQKACKLAYDKQQRHEQAVGRTKVCQCVRCGVLFNGDALSEYCPDCKLAHKADLWRAGQKRKPKTVVRLSIDEVVRITMQTGKSYGYQVQDMRDLDDHITNGSA